MIEYSIDAFNCNLTKTVVLIGAGKNAREILRTQKWNIRFAIDSNDDINEIQVDDIHLPVFGWNNGIDKICDSDVIVITPSLFEELEERLSSISSLKNNEVHLYIIMKALQWDMDRTKASNVPFMITSGTENKIPKRIHYFWFSGDPYPEKVKKCIDSWHKYCPEYEFIEWNLKNYQTDNEFCNQALQNSDWAFASDFGRCDVLYRYGGIYLDIDVEIMKPLDELLYDEGFMCFESELGVDPGSGMGAIPKHHIMKEICDKYYNASYYNSDGTVNHPNIIHMYTDVLEKYGLSLNAQYQKVEGMAIYPPLVMSPYSYMTGRTQEYDKTYAIHHWVSAWVNEKRKREIEESKRYFMTH